MTSSSPQGSKDPGRAPARFVSPTAVAIYGVLTALTAAVTMTIAVPFPPTRGFFNLGESMVFFSAFVFGFRPGGICGGIGSAIADVLLGFGYFAPITLVAKGSEGFVAGLIAPSGTSKPVRFGLAVAAGGSCMILTYFVAEVVLYGIGPAIAEIPVNITQAVLGGAIGIAISYPVANILRRSKRIPMKL